MLVVLFSARRILRTIPAARAFSDYAVRSDDTAVEVTKQSSGDIRRLPKTKEDFVRSMRSVVIQPENPHILKVAVIGMPNAGKSTLVNQLVGTPISAVSKRVHTTRRNVLGIFSGDSTQITFYDSPGLVTSSHCVKHHLEHTFRSQPIIATKKSDVILVVVDVVNPRDRKGLNQGIIQKLEANNDKESVLVLNKVDLTKKKDKLFYITHLLTNGIVGGVPVAAEDHRTFEIDKPGSTSPNLATIEERLKAKGHILTLEKEPKNSELPLDELEENVEKEPQRRGWPHFSRVFMVSALEGDGTNEIRDYLLQRAYPGKWQYHKDVITLQDPSIILQQIVKEKLLDNLPGDVPYVTESRIQSWDITRTGTLCVCLDLIVPKQYQLSQLLGPNGSTIAKIVNESRQDLSNSFQSDVSLKIVAKCFSKK